MAKYSKKVLESSNLHPIDFLIIKSLLIKEDNSNGLAKRLNKHQPNIFEYLIKLKKRKFITPIDSKIKNAYSVNIKTIIDEFSEYFRNKIDKKNKLLLKINNEIHTHIVILNENERLTIKKINEILNNMEEKLYNNQLFISFLKNTILKANEGLILNDIYEEIFNFFKNKIFLDYLLIKLEINKIRINYDVFYDLYKVLLNLTYTGKIDLRDSFMTAIEENTYKKSNTNNT